MRIKLCRAIPPPLVVAAVLLSAASVVPVQAKSRTVELHVDSNPSGALVSVHNTAAAELGGGMTVAGETPLTRQFRFPKEGTLWLRIEKRGFAARVVEVAPDTGSLSVDLERLDDEPPARAPIAVLAVASPDLTLIRRGFANESEDGSGTADLTAAIARAMALRLAGTVGIVELDHDEQAPRLRRIWRDVGSQMELVDPIRLPYQPTPPRMESRSARSALLELADQTGADAVLFVAGKQNVETGGMKAGKIGVMVVGTANSFAAGYSSAMANGNDFFTYTVYLPSFAEGLSLEALVVDARDASILWANKGIWKPLHADRSEAVDAVVADLLSGLEQHLNSTETLASPEEEP